MLRYSHFRRDARGPILIEGLALGNDSGLGKVTRMLVEALKSVLKDHRVVLITRRGPAFGAQEGWEQVITPARPYRFWIQAAFPLLIWRIRPRAVFCLGQTLPALRPRCKYVLLVPDVGPLEDLGIATSSHDACNRRLLPAIIKRADIVLTISKFSKSRIEKLTGVPSEKVREFCPIFQPEWLPGCDSAHAEGCVSSLLDRPYILSLGNIEPRKNYPALIRAYEKMSSRLESPPRLIIAGHKAWGYSEVERIVERSGLAGRVLTPGHLKEEEVRILLKNCLFFVSASIYEGWGFPLFEALCHARPAIYHADSSQDEFARDFARGIDCSRVEELARAMQEMCISREMRDSLTSSLKEKFPGVLKYDLPGRLDAVLKELI